MITKDQAQQCQSHLCKKARTPNAIKVLHQCLFMKIASHLIRRFQAKNVYMLLSLRVCKYYHSIRTWEQGKAQRTKVYKLNKGFSRQNRLFVLVRAILVRYEQAEFRSCWMPGTRTGTNPVRTVRAAAVLLSDAFWCSDLISNDDFRNPNLYWLDS
jgi:hypothetical protein